MCETWLCGYRMAGNIKQSSSKVNTPNQRQLLIGAVYAHLVHCSILPDLPLRTLNAITRSWGVSPAVVASLFVCGYPTETQNILICGHAAARFGDALGNVPGFYKQSNIDDGEGSPYDFWRLDLNEKWSDSGFIVPQTDRRLGIFRGLLAFRHPRDLKPFTVEVRGDRKVEAA